MSGQGRRNGNVKERIIEAAGELFALRGYKGATVRDICTSAGVHVGAVNYHFRDKEGLFAAALEHAHQWSVRRYPPDAGLGPNASAEERLRGFVRSFLLRVLGQGVPDWHGQLIARETSEPSEALNQMVRGSIHPLYLYLAEIVRELLTEPWKGGDEPDQVTFLCAMSVTSQCLQYFTSRHVIAALCPKDFQITDIERLTDHITRFSLGGIRAIAEGRNGDHLSPYPNQLMEVS